MGAAVVSLDGVTLASLYQLESSPSIVASTAAVLVGAAEQMSKAVLFESKAQVCVISSIGTLILSAVENDSILVVLTPRGYHLDSIVGNLERLAQRLGERITQLVNNASNTTHST
jgi:predicted regulator of Ras-like GTPase activity (Roadblock/LC7/MglB family)